MKTSVPTTRLQRFLRFAALAVFGTLLNTSAPQVSRADDNRWLTVPPGGIGKRDYADADFDVSAAMEFTLGPQGDWEFAGDVYGPLYDGQVIDWFATCAVRSSVGQYFQMSAQGTISFDDLEQIWPAPGHPRIAGRNPEIAAHWEEIYVNGTWDCRLGAAEHNTGSDGTLDDLSKALGVINSIITIVKVVVAAG